MPDNISALYNELKNTYNVGSEDDFRNYLSDPNNREALRKELESDYNVGDSTSFSSYLGFGESPNTPSNPKTQNPQKVQSAPKSTAETMSDVKLPSVADVMDKAQENQWKPKPILESEETKDESGEEKPGTTYVPTEAERKEDERKIRQMQSGVAQTGRDIAAQDKRREKVLENPFDSGAQRVEIGNTENAFERHNPRVVEGETTYNTETGEYETTYINEAGEYSSRESAERDQEQIDRARYQEMHPDYLEQANRQQVSNLSQSIDDRLDEITKKVREETDPEEYARYTIANGGQTLETVSPGYAELQAARRYMRDAQRIIDEADHNAQSGNFGKWLESSFAGGAARGFGQKLFDVDTWDFGESDLNDAGAMMKALRDFDAGKELTEEQRMMLDAKAVELATNAYFGSYVGKGYKAGQVTAESLPFMLEMCINPASATGHEAGNILARYALRRFAKKSGVKAAEKLAEKELKRATVKAVGKEAVKKAVKPYAVAGRMAGDLVGSTVMTGTTGAVGVAADTFDRTAGQVKFKTDQNGQSAFAGHEDGESLGTAFRKAFASRTIENYSEMLGEYFAPALGVVGRGMRKGMDKIGLESVGKFIDNVSASDFARVVGDFEQHAKWNGTTGEFAEEMAGGVLNSIFVHDQTLDTDKDTGVFNLDNMIDTYLGVGLMGGFFSGLKTAGYRSPKHAARKNMERQDDIASSIFKNQDKWGQIRNVVAFGSDEDIKAVLSEVKNDESLTEDQKIAAFKYAQYAMHYKGMLMAEQKRREENDPARTDLETSFDNGYTLEGQEMNDAKNMLEAKRQSVGEFCTDDLLQQIDSDPMAALDFIRTNENWTDEEKQTVLDYVNAKATYDGMIQYVRDDIDGKIEVSNEMIDGRVHKEDGMIYPAIMKIDNREVHIVGGKIALNADGTLDKENSDESFIIRDADTGDLEWAAPGDFLSIDSPIDAEQEKQTAAEAIRQRYAQQAADQIDGTLPFGTNDQYIVLDAEGQQHTVTVLPTDPTAENAPLVGDENNVLVSIDGGEPQVMSKELIQQMADNSNLSRLAAYEQERAAQREAEKAAMEPEEEAPSYRVNDEVTLQTAEGPVQGTITEVTEDGLIVQTEQPINGKTVNLFTQDELEGLTQQAEPAGTVVTEENNGGEATAPTSSAEEQEPMPMYGEGEDQEPDFARVTPARAHTYLYSESGLSREEADQFVAANKKAADKEVEKVQGKKPKMGTSIAKYTREKAAWQQQLDEALARSLYWQQVMDEQTKALEAEKQAEFEERTSDASGRKTVLDEQNDLKKKVAAAREMYGGYFDDDMTVAHDVRELIAMNLPTGINWEGKDGKRGLQQELGGMSRGVGKKYDTNAFNFLLAKKGEGISFAEAVHSIWESEMNSLPNGEHRYDDTEIRDAFLDMILSSEKPSDLLDYVLNSRIAQAEAARQAEDAARMEEEAIEQENERIRQLTGMEPSEYDAFISSLEESLALQEGYENSEQYFNQLSEENDRETGSEAERGEESGTGEVQGQESVEAGAEEAAEAGAGEVTYHVGDTFDIIDDEGERRKVEVRSGPDSFGDFGIHIEGVGDTALSPEDLDDYRNRAIEAEEQLKPTDLRDAVRPDSAEIGVNEANAKARYQLSSTQVDAEGNAFYEKDGSIDLWSLPELFKKARRQSAPIRLTSRNLQHILDEHHKELGDESKIFEFLDDIFANAKVLRKAKGRSMYVIVENDKTDKAAIIKLMPSEKGDYYNVETAGYYRKSKWKEYEDVIADLSEPDQSDAATDVSKPQIPEENGREPINAETQASSSEGKVTEKSDTEQEKEEKSEEKAAETQQAEPVGTVTEENKEEKSEELSQGEEPKTKATRKASRTRASKVGKIDDFGEKIGGARKDVARGRIRDTKKMTVKDLTTLKKGPEDILSQANIMRLYKDGQMDEQTARGFMALNNAAKIAIKYASPTSREIVLTKYRDAAVAWEEGKPVVFNVTDEDIKTYQSHFGGIVTEEKARESLEFSITDPFNMFMKTYEALNYPAVERKLGQYVILDYTSMKGRHYVPSRPFWVKNGLRAQRGYPFSTMEGAAEKLKTLCPEVKEKEKKGKAEKAEHGLRIVKEGYGFYIKSRNIPGNIYLSPKFYNEKQAQEYLDDNLERLKEREQRLVDALMGSNIGMAEREGVDYRNGKDVTPQDFLDEFGFRGVEFGNWVPQGERQMYLNKTYDAIKDFCAIVGISPKAFSLGGRLGLAFGARGKSRAMAHYEPGKEVINLTRMSGVGSLAHEWFHALDNYLAKQKTGNMSDMATETHDVVREELSAVFKDMYKAMRAMDYHSRSRRAGEYWGRTVEEFARLFENYIYNKLAAKEATSPVLVRQDALLDDVEEDMKGSWPYPSAEENAEMEPLFDNLFNTIQEKTDEKGNVVLYQRVDGSTIKREVDALEEALRDGVVRLMREAGMEVVTDVEVGQQTLDEANEARLSRGQKRALETVSIPKDKEHQQTVVSSAAGAKVKKSLETFAKKLENLPNNPVKTFIGNLAKELKAKKHGSNSQYASFVTENGTDVTIRLADHEAKVSNFDNHDEDYGISIVLSHKKQSDGIENDGDARIVEFFYNDIQLRKAYGKPLADIVRAVISTLETGEFNDPTGIAQREEVNPETIREMRVYHGTGADFDAFDHSHMSEGEGNQSYGWGSYVTEVEGIGRTYAKSVGNRPVGSRNVLYKGEDFRSVNTEDWPVEKEGVFIDLAGMMQRMGKSAKEAIGNLRIMLEQNIANNKKGVSSFTEKVEAYKKLKAILEGMTDEEYAERKQKEEWSDLDTDASIASFIDKELGRSGAILKVEEWIEDGESIKKNFANRAKRNETRLKYLDEFDENDFSRQGYFPILYTVDIPSDTGENYLDYKGRMNEQLGILEKVANALEEKGWKREKVDDRTIFTNAYQRVVLTPNQSGADLYEEISYAAGGARAASAFLSEIGVTGIKYPANYRQGGTQDDARNYVVFNENDLKITEKARLFRTKNGEVYGYALGGKIFLDPRIATSETPIHEYVHLWAEALRAANPKAWKQLKKEILDGSDGKNGLSGVYAYVKRLYPELEGDELVEEVFTHYAGQRGAEQLRQEQEQMLKEAKGAVETAEVVTLFDRIRRALQDFWEKARDLFAGKVEGIEKLSAADFADMAMNDLMRGVNPNTLNTPRDERIKEQRGDGIRFRDEEENPIFFSNAQRAVENIKQEKATPEQWLAMIQKAGGLKAGEDKWLGLSEWLTGQKVKSLTKQEVLEYIMANQIQVEEVGYEESSESGNQRMKEFNDEFNEIKEKLKKGLEQLVAEDEKFHEEMDQKYGYGWVDKMNAEEKQKLDAIESRYYNVYDIQDMAFEEMVERYGDDFRMAFEINGTGLAPIMEWNDEISDAAKYFLGEENTINSTRLQYTTEGLENKREIALVVPTIESWNEGDEIHFGDAGNGRAVAWIRFGETTDKDGNKVLVIDEIQSKRHQEGREKGYYNEEETKRLYDEYVKIKNEQQEILNKERAIYDEIASSDEVKKMLDEDGFIKPEYQERYKEITSSNQELKELARQYRLLESSAQEAHNALRDANEGIPDAPFEKNWHELAMKRMLRYAAENGYDKIAWTTGEQQAERYDLADKVDEIKVVGGVDNIFTVIGRKDGGILVQKDVEGEKGLAELIGKDMARKAYSNLKEGEEDYLNEDGAVSFTGEDLVIGGEGMKGFYDKMLPSFMNKYGKKWGVKVGTVELPNVEESARTMWSVDVTPEMRESVMEGQLMFRLREDEPPKNTGIGYKVFVLKDGKLYPPMVANPDGASTETGVWLDADAAPVAGMSKTGRAQVKAGGKGTQGGSGQLAYRPGWHLGTIPYALQFNRKDENGEKSLFPKNFVWAEVEYANDVDYQQEAHDAGVNANGKYQHSLAGLKRVPVNGSYMYRTNPNPATDPWIITGAMKVNRILKPSEVDEMVKAAGREPQLREAGAVTDEQVDALNKEIDIQAVERRYNELSDQYNGKPYEVVQLGKMSDDEVLQAFGLSEEDKADLSQEEAHEVAETLKEIARKRNTAGLYNPLTGKIVIFADTASAGKVEEAFFHENIHGILHDWYGDKARGIAERFWESVPAEGLVKKSAVERRYQEFSPEKQHEEFFTYWLGRAMVQGKVSEMLDMLNEEDRERVENILNDIGYDRESEEIQREESARDSELSSGSSDAGSRRPGGRSLRRAGGERGQSYEESLASSRAAGYTRRQHDSYRERVWRNMRKAAEDTVRKLGLGGRVTLLESAEGLKGRKARAKGWYDEKSGKIVVVLSNHGSVGDVVKTILHESVAHYGLRRLFGTHFDQFLDNVFQNADESVRREIVNMATKHGWDFREATEEYLAHLAEETDFERAKQQGWWIKIKSMFLKMLHDIGLSGFNEDVVLTDNELRYILWRSYENLVEPGRYQNPFRVAEDVVMQSNLGVGNYDKEMARIQSLGKIDNSRRAVAESVAESEGRTHFRDGEEALARDSYERMMASGANQFTEAVQDSMLSLKKLYEAIITGENTPNNRKGFRIEDVEGFENAYLAENRMSSSSQAQIHEWHQTFMNPIYEEVNLLTDGSREERDKLTDYMMAKHGLERNEVFARRDAENAAADLYDKEIAKLEKAHNDDPLDQDILDRLDDLKQKKADFIQAETEQNRGRDYAGLTALTGEDDVAAAEAAAQQMVDDYELEHDTDPLWEAVNNATKSSLDKIYWSGLLSKERYEQIRNMFEYYIPLQGFDETTAEDVYSYFGSDGTLGYGTPIRSAKGRKSKADDPLATIVMNGEAAIRQGNRNQMKQRFLNFVQNHPSDLVSVSDVWLRHNDVTDEWELYFDADLREDDTPEEVERKTREFEERMEQLAESDPDHYKRGGDLPNIAYRVVKKSDLKQHQVLVKRGGRSFVLTINGNPRAAQALNGLTNPDVQTEGAFGKIMNVGQRLNRELSLFYTTRNPEFVISNYLRDLIYSNSMTWVKESPAYALKFHKNFGKMNPVFLSKLFAEWESGALRQKVETNPQPSAGSLDYYRKLFLQFMENGGETGWTNLRDIEKHKRDFEKELKRERSASRQAWKAFWGAFDLVNRSVENNARFAAFVTSREMGRSIERSIFDAKEVSVNFNKKGAGDKFLNSKGQRNMGILGSYMGGLGRGLYVFFNASIQGINNIAKASKEHPMKATAGLAAPLFLLGASAYLISNALGGGGDDDDKDAYYNLPEYIRRSNLCFRWRDDMPWVTIPLPIEFRAIYGLGELATGVITGKERYSDEEFAKQFVSQLSQVLPLDFMEGGGGLHAFVPSQAKPLVEAETNKSWTGLPIYRDNKYTPNKPQWTRAYDSANRQIVAGTKWLNEKTGGDDFKQGYIDWNPAKIEYMLKGYLGGYFTMYDRLNKSSETLFGKRDFEWRNIPIASRVLKEGDERTEMRKIRNEYFNALKEYDATKDHLRDYKKAAESGREDAFQYAERLDFLNNSDEYARFEIMDAYKSLIDAYRDLAKDAEGDEKARLTSEQNRLTKDCVDALRFQQEAGSYAYDKDIEDMLNYMVKSDYEEVERAAINAEKRRDKREDEKLDRQEGRDNLER